MQDFTFCSPTKIFFGAQYLNEVGKVLSDDGYKNILIVYGRNSLEKSGFLKKILVNLNSFSLNCFKINGIRVNPTKDKVYEGIDIVRKNNIDFILAIGGGSVIDTAKAIAVGALYDGDFYDFHKHISTPTKKIPTGVILTIAAAGSELSDSCVISDDEANLKLGFNNDINRPKYAFMDPNFLKTLSKHQMATGLLDMTMHTLERYFYKSVDNDLCDNLALVIIKNVYDNILRYLENPKDYDALSNIMITSSLAHNGLTSIGKKPVLAIHKLEHCVGGHFPELVHADGLGILLIPWLKFYKDYLPEKIIKLGKFCFNLVGTDEEVITKTIETFETTLDKLEMPRHFSDLNIHFDPTEYANYFTDNGRSPLKYEGHDLDFKTVKTIYSNAQ